MEKIKYTLTDTEAQYLKHMYIGAAEAKLSISSMIIEANENLASYSKLNEEEQDAQIKDMLLLDSNAGLLEDLSKKLTDIYHIIEDIRQNHNKRII